VRQGEQFLEIIVLAWFVLCGAKSTPAPTITTRMIFVNITSK